MDTNIWCIWWWCLLYVVSVAYSPSAHQLQRLLFEWVNTLMKHATKVRPWKALCEPRFFLLITRLNNHWTHTSSQALTDAASAFNKASASPLMKRRVNTYSIKAESISSGGFTWANIQNMFIQRSQAQKNCINLHWVHCFNIYRYWPLFAGYIKVVAFMSCNAQTLCLYHKSCELQTLSS